MAILPEVIKSHVDALEHWARQYENDGGTGGESVAYFLRQATRVMGKIIKDPNTPPEPMAKQPPIEEPAEERATG